MRAPIVMRTSDARQLRRADVTNNTVSAISFSLEEREREKQRDRETDSFYKSRLR